MSEAANLLPVTRSGMCIACGACVAADPSLSLVLDPEQQQYVPNGLGNAAAARVCPSLKVDFTDLQQRLYPNQPIGPHGVVNSVWLAQSCDLKRNLKASSGGTMKELMLHCLAQDDVDGVIALTHVSGLDFRPKLLTKPEEIDQLPGSIYHNLPLDGTLKLLKENVGRFVLVAIPCQLEGIYNYVFHEAPELRQRILFTIGLICGWNYTHHALRAICSYTGAKYDDITDIAYRGGGPIGKLRITTPSGVTEVHRRVNFSYQVAFDRSFNVDRCHVCVNHQNILADIVFGDAWLPSTVRTKSGISIIVCRTPAADAMMRTLSERERIVATEVTLDDLTESQSRRVAFGDFAYAYAEFLKSHGEHCPDMLAPNRAEAHLAPKATVARFHEQMRRKQRMQRAGRYRSLWYRKMTVEIVPFLMRYVRWFMVRIVRIQSLLGKRKEVSSEQLKDFR